MHAAAIYFDASKGHVFEPAFRRNGFLLRRMTGDIVMDTRTMHGHLASRHAAAPSGRTLYLTTGDTDYR
jgi:hypothetical protein